ncbi:MAG: hypothetical protein ACSHYF_14205 [Verrucomicrobiaceae bacterium]
MKKIASLLALGFAALVLSSCCGLVGGGCGGGITHVGCEGDCLVDKKVTKYKNVTRTVDPGTKGGTPYEVTEQIAYETTVREKVNCQACGSIYCPSPGCCDTVSKAVLRRATAQGSSGEPHIGQIPTMKILAE